MHRWTYQPNIERLLDSKIICPWIGESIVKSLQRKKSSFLGEFLKMNFPVPSVQNESTLFVFQWLTDSGKKKIWLCKNTM